ncbi:MAG: helix-turn-helix transcriptional regulator [Candidatus Latescibacteria bacterium]|jgi:AraC-like DNA-binding protein|nr:helix-turn-helix transcriptional regulator [Candidatus Latescibacterota bacterium]
MKNNLILVVGDVGVSAVRSATSEASVTVVEASANMDAWEWVEGSDCILSFWAEEALDLDSLKEYFGTNELPRQTDFVVVGTPVADFVIRAFRAGVKDYIVGPLTAENINPILNDCCRYRKRAGSCLATKLDDFVEQEFGDQHLDMNSVAARFGITAGYVGRLFREDLGLTFRTRLAQRRISKASELLIQSDEPLYMIADQCGFRTPSRFTETFCSVIGITPREFRYNRRVGR